MYVFYYNVPYVGKRFFFFQDNYFYNSEVDFNLMNMQVSQESPMVIRNNYYDRVSVARDKRVVNFIGEMANVTINNETVVNSTLDDLHSVRAAANVEVRDVTVQGIVNTGAITEVSALLRVSKVSG